ncbi:MAG: lipid-A-disaccharide synthase [Cytophagaceae bacterium]|jgi:lipid-A-disaccharide synthase|nr:lipid-A-disaccharide synthase [Cytophagaceae bacterium]
MSKRFYLICGERSGDLHASNLIKALKIQSPTVHLRGIGGDLSEANGLELFSHYKEIAFMGFVEVFLNIFTLYKRLQSVKKDILQYRPDGIVLVDFGGFNMKIAAFAKANGIPVHYYISPKIWAWNTGRAWKIKKVVDNMMVILPFEKEFYRQFDFSVTYLGNPLRDAIDSFQPATDFIQRHSLPKNTPLIAVLPGSRLQEVTALLNELVQVQTHFPAYHFVIAAVSNLDTSIYTPYLKDNISLVVDDTYNLLLQSRAAIVASGTATLETALWNIPQVVVYRLNALSYFIAKRLIKVRYISLVNLIADAPVVEELIQENCTAESIAQSLKKIVNDGMLREEMLRGYQRVSEKIGEHGVSDKAAATILNWK